jgi:type I restriction enzyme S subunit
MAGEWKRVPLGEFVTLQRGHDLPDESRRSGHVPILGSFGITGWHDEARARGPGVTVGRSGASFGVVSYSPTDYWPLNTALYVIDFHGNDERFAYYFLQQFDFKAYNSGSAQPSLNRNFVHPVPVDVPPLPEQRAIAHILGTLDDKIELNRRMSETLEAMARALFKSWFVDFDPVRAKAEGRDPGLPQPLADLFPDSFEDSELGEIPRGWEVKGIGDLAEVVGGSTPKTERAEYWARGTHHWVTPKDLSGLSMPVLLDTERKITDAGLAQISSGLLPKGTVLLSSRAPIGYLAIAEVPVAVNQGFIAMKPRPGTSNLFLLRWASAAHDEIVSHANGSTFLEISKSSFRPIRTVAPAAPVMDAFDRVSRPIYLEVVGHERESRTLAALRDALLPKLISGELRVGDPARFLAGGD